MANSWSNILVLWAKSVLGLSLLGPSQGSSGGIGEMISGGDSFSSKELSRSMSSGC